MDRIDRLMWKQIAVRGIFFGLLTLILGGCGLIAAEGASTVFTGKTVSDHIVSISSGKDCSVVRKEQGLTYCVEDQPQYVEPAVKCSKTLGSVTCYKQPELD